MSSSSFPLSHPGRTANKDSTETHTQPVARPLQTVFGCFDISAYVYSRGANRRIELRPVDALLQLPGSYASYLFKELSQYFRVNDAFAPGQRAIRRVFRQSVSVETLERINRRVGLQAEAYLDELPAPPADEEGELLVLSGDGKGVPLIKADAERVPLFNAPASPGNRRMATLAAVYSVDRFERSKDDVLASQFREHSSSRSNRPKRPEPIAKQLTARFATERDLGDGPELISGVTQAFSWAARRINDRRRNAKPVICLIDGDPKLWDGAAAALGPDVSRIEILDLLHAACGTVCLASGEGVPLSPGRSRPIPGSAASILSLRQLKRRSGLEIRPCSTEGIPAGDYLIANPPSPDLS